MKKKTNDGTGNIARGTAIIIIAMVIVFGAVFAWMYSMDMLFLPSFVEDLIGKDDGEPLWDLDALSSLVKSGKDEAGQGVTFDVTYENLRTALLESEPERGICFSANVSYYSGDAYTRRVDYYRDGERFRIEIYEAKKGDVTPSVSPETVKISDGERMCVIDKASGASSIIAYAKEILPEEEAGIPSVEMLLEALEHFPSTEGEAMRSDITDTSLKLLRTDSGNVYYAAFTYGDIGLVEEYYVSLEHRIVISMTSTQNGALVYSYNVMSVFDEVSSYGADELYDISKATEQ